MHRAPQHHGLRRHRSLDLRYHLQGAGTRARSQDPTSTSQLLDIATNFASGEEAVGAIFSDGTAKGKQKAEATEASGSRDPKKKKGRKGKQGQSDDNLVAAADRKNPKQAPAGSGLFDEMLKKPCPYHRGPTKHTLEECSGYPHQPRRR